MEAVVPGGGPGEEDGPVPPPRWAPAVVVAVVGLMLVAFLGPIPFTLWPATSWELFSRIRSSDQATFDVHVVGADGEESPLPFARLGPEHERWLRAARALSASSPAEQERVCVTWGRAAAAELGTAAVEEVRVDRVVQRAGDRLSDPPREVDRREVLRCEVP